MNIVVTTQRNSDYKVDTKRLTDLIEDFIAAQPPGKRFQKRFAELVGVPNLTVSRWKRGKNCPRLNRVIRMAEVLGVAPEDLLINTSASAIAESIEKYYPQGRISDRDERREGVGLAEEIAQALGPKLEGLGRAIERAIDRQADRINLAIDRESDRITQLVRSQQFQADEIRRLRQRIEPPPDSGTAGANTAG